MGERSTRKLSKFRHLQVVYLIELLKSSVHFLPVKTDLVQVTGHALVAVFRTFNVGLPVFVARSPPPVLPPVTPWVVMEVMVMVRQI